jgi:hypothetical protein
MRPNSDPLLPRSACSPDNLSRLRNDALRRLAEEEQEISSPGRKTSNLVADRRISIRRRILRAIAGSMLAGVVLSLIKGQRMIVPSAYAASDTQQGKPTATVYGGPPPAPGPSSQSSQKKPVTQSGPQPPRPPAPVYGGPPPPAPSDKITP